MPDVREDDGIGRTESWRNGWIRILHIRKGDKNHEQRDEDPTT